jgi:hypothetical protein
VATSVAAFFVAFPEFKKLPTAQAEAQLAFIEATTHDGWGSATKRDYAVYLSLADALATSPAGRDAQLIAADAKTSTYRLKLWSLMKAHACLHPDRLGTLPSGVPIA